MDADVVTGIVMGSLICAGLAVVAPGSPPWRILVAGALLTFAALIAYGAIVVTA